MVNGMAGDLAFTTRGLDVRARTRAMRTLVDQGLLPVEPLAGATPGVDLVKWHLVGASVLRGRFVGVRQHGAPGTDELFVGINTAGTSHARQGSRWAEFGPGDALVVDVRGGTFSVDRSAACRMIGVRLDRRTLPSGAADSDQPTLRVIGPEDAAVRLLTGYLQGTAGTTMPTNDVAGAFVRHLAELIALALRSGHAGPPPTQLPGIRAARLAAIKADISRHLTDEALSPAAVAARHGITLRYLHKLFEDDGRTYSRFVLDGRLDLAHRRLREPRAIARTVSAIAHDAGFGDLSYFNRTFRTRYGRTPSEVRGASRVCDPDMSEARRP
jgi:AraC-like DNA-binding protein